MRKRRVVRQSPSTKRAPMRRFLLPALVALATTASRCSTRCASMAGRIHRKLIPLEGGRERHPAQPTLERARQLVADGHRPQRAPTSMRNQPHPAGSNPAGTRHQRSWCDAFTPCGRQKSMSRTRLKFSKSTGRVGARQTRGDPQIARLGVERATLGRNRGRD